MCGWSSEIAVRMWPETKWINSERRISDFKKRNGNFKIKYGNGYKDKGAKFSFPTRITLFIN